MVSRANALALKARLVSTACWAMILTRAMDDLLADHAVRGDCESRELVATRCLMLPVLGNLGFGAILELLLDRDLLVRWHAGVND